MARAESTLPAAREAELAGDLPAAEKAYENDLKIRPAAETWQRLGFVRHLPNTCEAAIQAFREAPRLDPSLWTSHLFLGICLYRTNQFAQALSALEQAQRVAPRNQPGRDELDYWLGATRIALKQPLAGLQSLERLLARNPKHLEGALEAYRQSKALSPRRDGPGLAIGRLLLRKGRAEEALAALNEELTLAPGDPETSFAAGLAAIQLGRYVQAAQLMETATSGARENPEAPLALAQVYLALREP